MNKSSSPQETPDENAGDAALEMLLDSAPATPDDAATETPNAPAKEISVPATAALDEPPVLAKLDAATRNLLMPSESDEPFRTVYWPLDKTEITASEVALYLTENADASVQTGSVEDFFSNAALVEDWMDDDEKANAEKFQHLIETLNEELEKPRVYRIGEREITAAIIGKTAGGFAGVVTTVIET